MKKNEKNLWSWMWDTTGCTNVGSDHKIFGKLGRVREIAESVVELSNEFAIVTVREDRLEALAGIEAVEYIEKPKRLFFQVENGRRVSCMTSVQIRPPKLYGTGVLVAIIDSGIDYANLDFRNADGTTRIYSLWDQTIPGNLRKAMCREQNTRRRRSMRRCSRRTGQNE